MTWFVMSFLWFCAACTFALIVVLTPVAETSRSPDFSFTWLFLAAGAVVGATGHALTWARVMLDVRWLGPPHRARRDER
ncbi:MAG: hypothetical protein WAT39_09205 [Planctomycetota bacterium]